MRTVPRTGAMDRTFGRRARHVGEGSRRAEKTTRAAQLRWRKERHRSLRIRSTAVWIWVRMAGQGRITNEARSAGRD
jgi:hypothetical protein